MYNGFIFAVLYCLYVIASGATFVLNWMLFWLFLPFIVYMITLLLMILMSVIYAFFAPKEHINKTLKWLDKHSNYKYSKDINELLSEINELKK